MGTAILQQSVALAKELRSLVAAVDGGLTFSFVESQFVMAIRCGYWVLLDNINSAPPEVIERLNSLAEEQPVLNLYEHSQGQRLSRDDNSIHAKFRLFATA